VYRSQLDVRKCFEILPFEMLQFGAFRSLFSELLWLIQTALSGLTNLFGSAAGGGGRPNLASPP